MSTGLPSIRTPKLGRNWNPFLMVRNSPATCQRTTSNMDLVKKLSISTLAIERLRSTCNPRCLHRLLRTSASLLNWRMVASSSLLLVLAI